MHLPPNTSALALSALLMASTLLAQPAAVSSERVIRMSGALAAPGGAQPVRFAVYDQETGGTLLWEEVQTVTTDATGQYSVLLGSTSADGLPVELFAGGAARWLSVQGGPRTLLTAVPFAVAAATASDAETLAGRPATDYLLTPAARRKDAEAGAGAVSADPALHDSSPLPSGTIGRIGKFVTGVDLGDSIMFESGSRIGFNTTSPLDTIHSRFTNTDGSITGLAVQNLGSTATSYSGMLFYDHLGNLGQFQGFNNSTKEYRINNIATSGTINFMIGSTSAFLVDTSRNIGIGQTTPSYKLDVLHAGSTGVRIKSSSSFSVVDIDAQSGDAALRFLKDGVNQWNLRNRPGDDFFEIFELGGGGSRMVIEDSTGFVGIGSGATANPLDMLHVDGDIRVGTGTAGCVKDANGTVIAGTCSSDLRFKKDVTPFGSMLGRFAKLSPVHFTWRGDEFTSKGFGTQRSWGFVAQDVQQSFPELVTTDGDGYLAVNYSKVPLLTVQAVKELLSVVEQKDAEIKSLSERVAALEAALRTLTTAVQRQR